MNALLPASSAIAMRGPTVVESPERVTLSDENKVFVREASRPNIHQREELVLLE
jgi:hypothetical protein